MQECSYIATEGFTDDKDHSQLITPTLAGIWYTQIIHKNWLH